MNGNKVLELLLPKLKKQFEKEKKGKDPRLGASLSKNEIKNNSELIYMNKFNKLNSYTFFIFFNF